MKKPNILILGGTGWIGGNLAESLKRFPSSTTSTYFKTKLKNNNIGIFFDYHKKNTINSLLILKNPDIVINAISGIDKDLFDMHTNIIQYCKQTKSHYIFLSSSLVFDKNTTHAHKEIDPIGASSAYGLFKERCEKVLTKSSINYIIFRFCAPHGYAQNRKSRTELFLQKLSHNEKIIVNTPVLQNRLFIKDLTDMMATVIVKKNKGIFHLGTIDSSAEIDFLKKITVSFGYDAQKITPKKITERILVTTPAHIFKLVGKIAQKTEKDTIEKLLSIPEFQKYKRGQ